MARFYSDPDDIPYVSKHEQSNYFVGTGWQSPVPKTIDENSPSSSIIRLVVESPFGSKKCTYTIDKSQRGRLIISARRRGNFPSDYLSSKPKNDVITQTYPIPIDADVDHLQSYIERRTNRLIIEMPRIVDYAMSTKSIYSMANDELRRSPFKYQQRETGRTVEYRVDCTGYRADQLELFLEGDELIVQGRANQKSLTDPIRSNGLKKFSRKIHLPPTIDSSRILSFFDNGELTIQAPVKRVTSWYDEQSVGSGYNAVRSRMSPTRRHYYRRHRRVNRNPNLEQISNNYRLANTAMRRVRSAESLNYPMDRFHDDLYEADRRRRQSTYPAESVVIYRSSDIPYNPDFVMKRQGHRSYPSDDETSFQF